MTARLGIRLLMLFSILLTGVLYFGNFTQKKKEQSSPAHSIQPTGLSFEDYEQLQLTNLQDEQLVTDLKQALKSWQSAAEGVDKGEKAHELALKWKAAGNTNLEAYYHYQAALSENNSNELAQAGDRLFSLYRISQDTLIKNNLITFALRSLEAALERDPDNQALKVRLGSAYVEGSQEPMKGISLLREVIAEEPENTNALIMLGRFAILSGQYDKAKERFDQVLKIDPNNAEAIYFMAITQEGLGNYEKAVELLEACKKLVANPDFDAEVNGYIEQLKNKIK